MGELSAILNGSLILVNLKSIMGENGIPMEYQNGGNDSRYENGEMLNGVTNGDHKHHSSKHKHKDKNHDKERRKETEEERRIRKEKERDEREKRYQKEGKRMETEEERAIRKEKERREKDEKYRNDGRRQETEEERAARKEKERAERHNRDGRKEETEEERRIRKEKERRDRDDKHRSRDKEHSRNHKETEEERKIRKDRERRERKEREAEQQKIAIKEENTEIKTEPEDSQDNDTAGSAYEEDAYMQEHVKEEPESEDEDYMASNTNRNKRKIAGNNKADLKIHKRENKKLKQEVVDAENEDCERQNDANNIKDDDGKEIDEQFFTPKEEPNNLKNAEVKIEKLAKHEIKQEDDAIDRKPNKKKTKKESAQVKTEKTDGVEDSKKIM